MDVPWCTCSHPLVELPVFQRWLECHGIHNHTYIQYVTVWHAQKKLENIEKHMSGYIRIYNHNYTHIIYTNILQNIEKHTPLMWSFSWNVADWRLRAPIPRVRVGAESDRAAEGGRGAASGAGGLVPTGAPREGTRHGRVWTLGLWDFDWMIGDFFSDLIKINTGDHFCGILGVVVTLYRIYGNLKLASQGLQICRFFCEKQNRFRCVFVNPHFC